MTDGSSEHLYYRHSGSFSLSGAFFSLCIGLLAGAPMAWLYARFIHWDPFIYFNALACCLFGALVGGVSEQCLISFKCRNVVMAFLVAMLAALGSYYLSWAVWLHTVINKVSITEFLRPAYMLGGMLAVNEHGVWTYHGSDVKGVMLWGLWVAEAGVMLGCACYFATHEMLESTFCEGCETWAKEQKGTCTVAAPTPPVEELSKIKGYRSFIKGLKAHAAELKQRLENKDLAYLEQLGPVPPGAIAWYRFDLNSCPKCSMTNTLRVTQLRHKVEGKKVRRDTEDKEVLRQLRLSSGEVEALRKLGQKPATG